ncbi:MAG: class I SAM-dependent methyltransferase [Melioribacteraceae bacterium]
MKNKIRFIIEDNYLFERIINHLILFYDKKIRKSYSLPKNIEIINIEKFFDFLFNNIYKEKNYIKEKLDIEFLKLYEIVNKKLINNQIPQVYNADISLAKLCYHLVRIKKPKVIIETGVGNGVTSFFILNAIKNNELGTLFSIDLPPLSSQNIGLLVEDNLKINWKLHLGTSLRLLRKIKRLNNNKIDIFIHDSANIYTIQKYEVNVIYNALCSYGIIIMNNIGTNSAFIELLEELKPTYFFVIEQINKKNNYTGIMIK